MAGARHIESPPEALSLSPMSGSLSNGGSAGRVSSRLEFRPATVLCQYGGYYGAPDSNIQAA